MTGQNRPTIHVEPRAVVRWEDATPARTQHESLVTLAKQIRKRTALEKRLKGERARLAETQARIDAIMAEYARVRE